MKFGRKFRRKTLRQWAAFTGRRMRKSYRDDVHLHRYENEVIVRKWRETGRTMMSAKELAGFYPDLFDPNLMPRTLKRMAKDGVIEYGRHMGRFTGNGYKLKELGDAKSEAA